MIISEESYIALSRNSTKNYVSLLGDFVDPRTVEYRQNLKLSDVLYSFNNLKTHLI